MNLKGIENYVEAYRRNYDFSGVVLAAKGSRVVFKKSYGYASIEHRIRNKLETKFLIGSITKQFTAFAVLMLYEKGKLKLQDKLNRYVPDFPHARKITIHQLLTHTSGVFNSTDLPGYFKFKSQRASAKQVIGKFAAKPLCFKPGTQMSYSNSGYFLLGHIIELVSGDTYESVLKKQIFEPLGMNSTGLYSNTKILENLATGYEVLNGDSIRAGYLDSSWPFSAGGLYSTAWDLYAWNKHLINSHKLLTKRTKI